MTLTCVAIDDEPLALEVIKAFAGEFPVLYLVSTFNDAIAGAQFLADTPVDLLFIDIDMPDISGLELIRGLKVKPLIIFTTAYQEFAFDGFELEAVDYLLKPIEFDRFGKAVNKALEVYAWKHTGGGNSAQYLYVHSDYKLLKIDLNEIDYIERLKDYMQIHLLNAEPILTLMTLKKVMEKLPEGKFARIHRSYVVPIAKVKAIANRKVELASGKELPVSESYLDFIQKWKDA